MGEVQSQLKSKLCKSKLSLAPMKKMPRAMYKFVYKYQCNANALTDVLRVSYIFEDLDSLRKAATIIDKAFATETSRGILNCKDRIFSPSACSYSDVLLNVNFDGIICEIQLQLCAFYELKHVMHSSYKVARHFGTEFEEICFGKQ